MASTEGAVRGDQLKDLVHAADWGPWRLYPPTLVLVHIDDDGYEDYEVDLEQCLTSAEVCDWLFQIAGKAWGNEAAIAGLVRALDEVLDPQANLCSDGASKKISRHKVAELVKAAAQHRPGMVHVRAEDGA